jgi:hypothetical protein
MDRCGTDEAGVPAVGPRRPSARRVAYQRLLDVDPIRLSSIWSKIAEDIYDGIRSNEIVIEAYLGGKRAVQG